MGFGKDALFDIFDQEVALRIITGIAKGHLGQVIRAEGEELRHLGDFSQR